MVHCSLSAVALVHSLFIVMLLLKQLETLTPLASLVPTPMTSISLCIFIDAIAIFMKFFSLSQLQSGASAAVNTCQWAIVPLTLFHTSLLLHIISETILLFIVLCAQVTVTR